MSPHSEFKALLAGINNVYDGTVPAKPAFPYVLVTSFIPRVGERSINRTVHSKVERWRTTIAGVNSDSVRIIANRVVGYLEGARIGGWRLERVPDDFPIWEDLDFTNPDTGRPLHYTILEWRVTTG